jgi:predicted HTH transcriptional regulator
LESLECDELLKLIARGEDSKTEFKFEVNEAAKIAVTLSAFSNSEGGVILIGVKDNGKISGIRTDEEYYMIESAAQMHCNPEPVWHARVINCAGKHVLKVEVEQAVNKPVYALGSDGKSCAYLRYGAENLKADAVFLKYWKLMDDSANSKPVFSNKQLKVIEVLKEHPGLLLNPLTRFSKLHRIDLVTALALLMKWKVVGVQVHQGRFHYELIKN